MIPNSEWVIQLVMTPRKFDCSNHSTYLPWVGYSCPMTGDQAMRVLRECEAIWPAYEFRAHPLEDDATRFHLPGQSADWVHPARL
jgi:hypothetical protein